MLRSAVQVNTVTVNSAAGTHQPQDLSVDSFAACSGRLKWRQEAFDGI